MEETGELKPKVEEEEKKEDEIIASNVELEEDTVDKDFGCVKGNDDMHNQRKKMRRYEEAVVDLVVLEMSEMDGTSLTVMDVWSDGDMYNISNLFSKHMGLDLHMV
ncbi:BnaA09g14760D [Brassica napus]|uniref:Uncharacterized protein n=2 Tax=Brassica TaxID=3705 RepID=M4EGG0_BRACM|nr:unnamed protein product [Brassica napus]CDY39894.1 BnaA09g14760D [Brassica napus]